MSELPPEVDKVLVEGGYKGKLGAMAHNTLVHRIAVLSKAHQWRQLKNPCHDPKVREPVSYTHLDVYKRQLQKWLIWPGFARSSNSVNWRQLDWLVVAKMLFQGMSVARQSRLLL